MGWASASSMMKNIIDEMQLMFWSDRYKVYKILIKEFQDEDADTLDECLGKDAAYDDAFFVINPEAKDFYNE